MSTKELKPIRERPADYDALETRIRHFLVEMIYEPIMAELLLEPATLKNAKGSPLLDALRAGSLILRGSVFEGRFSAEISRELKRLGGVWNTTSSTYKLPESSLSREILEAAAVGARRFEAKLRRIDEKLQQKLPANFADSLATEGLFEKLIGRKDAEIRKSLKNISVLPPLSEDAKKRLAAEWQGNMDLWITDFTEKEIRRLRLDIQAAAEKGQRYGSLVKAIQRSYGVSADKARFLARQETSLLVTKLKEVRYTEGNVHEYKWRCVVGSPAHPVRPAHKALDGKVFRWDTPPITTPPGEPPRRNNPGQDFNCRCAAIPIVKFRDT